MACRSPSGSRSRSSGWSPGADAVRRRPGHRRRRRRQDVDAPGPLGPRAARPRPAPGRVRHHAAPVRRLQLARRGLPHGPAHHPARPTGSARRCPSGSRPARWSASAPPTSATSATRSTSWPAASARSSPSSRSRVILLHTSVPLGLVVVLGVPVLMAVVGVPHPAAAPPPAGLPRPGGRADHPGRRHRRRPAGAARRRRRVGLRRPLPGRVAGAAGGGRTGGARSTRCSRRPRCCCPACSWCW